jgi:NAD(P)-dependent dehydrogenase (short-subunit alcohol dehydrogenase family)
MGGNYNMNLFDLHGKKAIVTGTSGLLGPIWCEMLRNAGAEVFEIDYPLYDLGNKEDIERAYHDSYADIEAPPDYIILNAGVDAPPRPGAKNDKWDEGDIMTVNYFGNKYILKLFEEDLKEGTDVKRVIYIGSFLGLLAADYRNYNDGFDKSMDYGASKRAFMSVVQNLSVRWAKYNILVNMLSFSMIDGKGITDEFKNKFLRQMPIGRPIYKDDVVRAMWGELINTYRTGQITIVDGGRTAW